MKGTTTRLITIKECPWLHKHIPEGTTVFQYFGCTYGCIEKGGVAVTDVDGKIPFYEIPANAVRFEK